MKCPLLICNSALLLDIDDGKVTEWTCSSAVCFTAMFNRPHPAHFQQGHRRETAWPSRQRNWKSHYSSCNPSAAVFVPGIKERCTVHPASKSPGQHPPAYMTLAVLTFLMILLNFWEVLTRLPDQWWRFLASQEIFSVSRGWKNIWVHVCRWCFCDSILLLKWYTFK